jgi:hypothetical protein
MKILVFTEGTVFMHASLKDLTREQRVETSKKRPRPFPPDFFKNEIPAGKAVKKLQAWENQGAEIFYLTSRTTPEQISDIRDILKKYNFPDNQNLLFRRRGEEYKDVAEKLMPDILVEDDCESIGGEKEMTYTHIKPEFKKKIKSIMVKEFGGIDHLPDNLEELRRFGN